MYFASDNTGPVHPRIMEAIAAANAGYAPAYGGDDLSRAVVAKIREIFEAPEAAVFLVGTGSAANALLLSVMVQPFQTVFCSQLAHIHTDECAAPEFFTGGSKLTLVPGSHDKLSADGLARIMAELDIHDEHLVQPGAVSITQVTERGTLYALDEIRAISDAAAKHDVGVHMDGARFANALAALGCTPAEMTWKAGVDTVSFGGTKNGCMGVEAVILFDPGKAWEFELRRKRAGHFLSKQRFMAAQMAAYLEGDLWLEMGRAANAACATLVRGLRQRPEVSIAFEPEANMVFASFPRRIHRALKAAGAQYGTWSDVARGDPEENVTCRLVCDWSMEDALIERFLTVMRDAA